MPAPVFLSYGDSNLYVPAPGGVYANGLGPAAVTGSTQIVTDANPFGGGSTKVLQLSPGASMTTGTACDNTLNMPTFRLFYKNLGAATNTLKVQVLFPGASNPLGPPTTISVKSSQLNQWVLSPPLNLPPPPAGAVAFQVSAPTGGSTWEVDDIYIDPRLH